MKGIVNVNIAGIAFRLDDAAYGRLDDYLRRIRESYDDPAEGAEITGDLEARVAEIILTRQSAATLVPVALIDEALAQLGAPEEIAGSGGHAAEGSDQAPPPASGPEKRIAHRLYRNPEGAKLGGVCSGLATYFDIDASLVRLLFAAPLVLMIAFFILDWDDLGRTMGPFMTTAFILYPLLWIAIPRARTPLQQLEMCGERITRQNLEQTFRREFDRSGNAPEHIARRARSARNASVLSEIVTILGRIVLFFIKAVVAIIAFGFIIAIVAVLTALGFALTRGSATPHLLVAVLVCLVVLIPLVLAVYGILKFLFGFRHNRTLLTTMTVVWLLTLAFGTVILIKDFDKLRSGEGFGWNRFDWSWHDDDRWRDDDEARQARLARQARDWTSLDRPFVLPTLDTLHIATEGPLPDADGFVLKIHRGDTARLVQRRWASASVDPVVCVQRGDTLFFSAPGTEVARTEYDLYLPEELPVAVARGIDYNEYLTGGRTRTIRSHESDR